MSSKNTLGWPSRLPKWMLKSLINLWGPFLGMGIHVDSISPDFRRVEASMKLRWYNTNYVGTHFGGSMYATTDAFYMLILINNLGRNYIVWDKAASIEFKKPAKGKLKAIFTFTEDELQAIRDKVDQDSKMIFDKSVDLIDQNGDVVATAVKTLYVRKKHKNIKPEDKT